MYRKQLRLSWKGTRFGASRPGFHPPLAYELPYDLTQGGLPFSLRNGADPAFPSSGGWESQGESGDVHGAGVL